jgi:hypothetical protein
MISALANAGKLSPAKVRALALAYTLPEELRLQATEQRLTFLLPGIGSHHSRNVE